MVEVGHRRVVVFAGCKTIFKDSLQVEADTTSGYHIAPNSNGSEEGRKKTKAL